MNPTGQSQSSAAQWVVFLLDEQRYALSLARVDHVVRMAAYTPLPKAPEIISGLVNVHGDLIPVVNLRKRFRLPERLPSPQDQLMIVHSTRRTLALAVDAVDTIVSFPEADLTSPEKLVPGLGFLRGVIRLPNNDILLVNDLDSFLSLDDETELDAVHPAEQTR